MRYVSSTDSQATITNASGQLVAANPDRRGIAISNPSTSDIWVAKGSPATVGKGIYLKLGGGAYTDDRLSDQQDIYTGVYSAIAVTAGSNNVGIQEDSYEVK